MSKAVNISDIVATLPGCIYQGDMDIVITGVIKMDASNERGDVLFWCSDKNAHILSQCKKGVVLCSQNTASSIIDSGTLHIIVVNEPRIAFAKVVEKYFKGPVRLPGIASTAVIHPSASIGKNVFIGEYVVIEKDVVIGDNSSILHGSVILEGTLIGTSVKIGSNNSIGGEGLGYAKGEDGLYTFIPHIGNVVIMDRVDTGSGCAIDRAALGSTIIGFNTKLDNFIHVAHGVTIGENCIITASVMIAGSTSIGNNVWIGPSSAIMNKITVGDNAFIGLGSVVIKSVEKNSVVAGNPARHIRFQ